MKKMLLVVCVVMLASLIASAQLVSPTTYNRTFYGYCDGEHLVLQKIASGTGVFSTKVYVAGYQDLVDGCGFSSNAPVVGQKHGVGAKVPPAYFVGISAPVLDVGSADVDAQCLCFSGQQYEYLNDVRDGFSSLYRSFLGFDGDYYCCSQTLVNGLPAKGNVKTAKPSGGTIAAIPKSGNLVMPKRPE